MIELFVTPLCPWATRVRLAAAEKRLPVVEAMVDLRAKPAWLARETPQGKIPVLRHDGRCIWDAAAIVEYLEEVFPERPLLPSDPPARARARAWVAFADARLYGPTEALLHSNEPSTHARINAALAEAVRVLETQAGAPAAGEGPYWLGPFTLADVALYPWFEQLAVLEAFRGFRPPRDRPRLQAWAEAVAARPAVRSICRPPEFYLQAYGALAAASQSG